MLDLWARGHYKDQDISTPTLTTKGWKNHGDLRPGDYVFSPTGKPVKVIAISGLYNYSNTYKVTFRNGEQLIVGAGHLWDYQVHDRHRSVRARITKLRSSTLQMKEHVGKYHSVRINIACPLQFKRKNLPVDSYILGCWLGDGAKSSGVISGVDNEVFEKIKISGFELTSRPNGFYVKGLFPLLKKLNLSNNKHIPWIYQTASINQRIELLKGLMDTDGHFHKSDGKAVFTQIPGMLCDDVELLIRGLGYDVKRYEFKNNHKGYVQLHFKADKNTFSLTRKTKHIKLSKDYQRGNGFVVDSIEPCERVQTRCIQVEGSRYLTGKSLIPTCNSTIITFAKTIQDILASHGENPIYSKELTFGIFSFKRPIATQFLSQIKRELESNEILQQLFPDILFENPKRESKKWSDEGIILKRKSNPKEATIEAWGVVEGQPTSKHFDVLIYDDVVTIENVRSKDMIKKTNHAWELSLNLGAKNAWFRYIGTRYHYDDTYSLIMRRGVAKPRIHTAESKDGKPVLLTKDELESKKNKMGIYVYNCQMNQNPVQEENQVFNYKWLSDQYYTYSHHDNMNIYIVVDNASSKKEDADFTVMWVIGLATDNNYYLLDCIRDRLSLTERADCLFKLHRKWKPLHVGYERYGIQADIEYLKERMNTINYHFHVVELGGRLSKEDRIKKLVPYFERKRIYLPESLFYTTIDGKLVDLISIFIEEEYKRFPFSTHDDMLDSLARIVDENMETYWPSIEDELDKKDRYRKKKPKNEWSQWSA